MSKRDFDLELRVHGDQLTGEEEREWGYVNLLEAFEIMELVGELV